MIPARLLDLGQFTSFTPVQLELDEGGEGSGLGSMQRLSEALFSYAHRSRRTTPVPMTTSGWEDSDSEPEIVATTHSGERPWFDVVQHPVVSETALDEALDELQEDLDLDAPIKFRPFMAEAMKNIRRRLTARLNHEFLLDDVQGSSRDPRNHDFYQYDRDVVFPVKRRCCRRIGSRPSDSPEF
jgi:hypothetical protein